MAQAIYDLEDRLLKCAVKVIQVVELLPNTKTSNHIARQLLRSGTSAYPNHGEAQSAESSDDFIHKFRISLKELRETERWLKLVRRIPLVDNDEVLNALFAETDELIKIFVVSIRTDEGEKI